MKRRKTYQSLIFLMLFIASVFTGPSLIGAQQLNVAPPNPEFVNYLDSVKAGHLLQQPSEHGLGLIPSPVDLSHLRGTLLFQGAVPLSLPLTYDLRTSVKLTAIRNQGQCGSCWAFGTYSSLESNLLPSETWDFSENNLINSHGFDWGPCAGGNAYMSTAYLARWDGPINEFDDPYIYYPSPSGLLEKKHVQEVLIVPDRGGPLLDNDNIKKAVMTYGAVMTSMCWSDPYYSSTYSAYYYNGTSSCPGSSYNTNHAVAIVGWDDDFPASRFPSSPPGNGAFIIRNSWGTGWGESGYFYISYYDTRIGTGNFLFKNAEPISNYGDVYQYDPLGWVGSTGYGVDITGTGTAWLSNVFTANSNEPLGAVGFYTASLNSAYELYIYTNVTSPPRGGSLAASKSGTIQSAGYHTIPLDAPVPLTSGQPFSVVVKLTIPGYAWPIAVEYPYSGYSSAATANPGESYASSDGTTDWIDLTLVIPNGNVCLKAFTIGLSRTSIGLYNPSNSTFFLRNSNTSGDADLTFKYGPNNSTWKPVVGHWNGDGVTTVGLYDAAGGLFRLKNSNTPGAADVTFRFGPINSTWLPIIGDWDGNGTTTVGLYDPVGGLFRLKNSNAPGAADVVFRFGPINSTWLPIVGDWDGNGTTTVGLYDPVGGMFRLKNSNAPGVADVVFKFGPINSTWLPIIGDWDGNGTTTVGLYDPVGGMFRLRNSNTPGNADLKFGYGPINSTWLPIVGDWDGLP